MKLLSVNAATLQNVPYRGRTVTTGIFKEPLQNRVMVRTLGLDGDKQADLSVHGGPDKAIYAYPFEHYASWTHELGRNDLTLGQFGENFTVEGMLEDDVHIGDIFHVGSALVEVTQPRQPCYKLGIKMGDARFPKRFLTSGRSGFYLRVLEEGEVGAGDVIHRVKVDPKRMTVRQAVGLAFSA